VAKSQIPWLSENLDSPTNLKGVLKAANKPSPALLINVTSWTSTLPPAQVSLTGKANTAAPALFHTLRCKVLLDMTSVSVGWSLAEMADPKSPILLTKAVP
jgi:hypothetical protein